MDKTIIICGVLIAMFVGGFMGYLMRGQGNYTTSLSMGFDETKNVWNRIRVDEQGNVICHKEKE